MMYVFSGLFFLLCLVQLGANMLTLSKLSMQGELRNVSAALRVMLDTVAHNFGYDPPVARIETRGDRHRCFLDFYQSDGDGEVKFKAAGVISSSIMAATETALYRGLLTLCVNCNVEINDVNRGAYLFAKDRVGKVSSDVVSLGNFGSCIC